MSKGRSETGGLDYEIHIKEGARVMLTTNIDIDVNQTTSKVTVIYVKFDCNRAGHTLIGSYHNNPFVRENNVVPIEPVLTRIKL